MRTLVDALGAVITRMRERIEATAEPDPVSQDILIGLTAGPGEAHWMFQAENVTDTERRVGRCGLPRAPVWSCRGRGLRRWPRSRADGRRLMGAAGVHLWVRPAARLAR